MREIKFRAWDKQMNFGKGGVTPWENLQVTEMLAVFEDPDLVLMQYTGLKDRNGKEIYEGDVVRIVVPESLHVEAEWWEDDIQVGEIYYERGAWKIRKYLLYSYIGVSAATFEVIGNIYENPELLDNLNGQ